MVVDQDHHGRLGIQGGLDDLPGMNTGPIDGPPEELYKAEEAVLRVEEQDAEILAIPLPERDREKVAHQTR